MARAGAVSRCGPVNARLTPRWRPVKAPSAAAAREGAAAEPAAALLYTYTGGQTQIERESRHKPRRRGHIHITSGDYVDLRALRSRFVTQMSTRERALHSCNGWGFAAGGDGNSLPGDFLVLPRDIAGDAALAWERIEETCVFRAAV